ATQATTTFRYQPNTTGVPQAVVDEAERGAAMAANAADRVRVVGQAKAQVWAWSGGQNAQMAGAQAAPAPTAPSEATRFVNNYQAMGRLAKPRTANEPGRAGDLEEKDKDVRDSERLSRRRAMVESSKKLGGQRAEVQPRERFVESAYWNPSVVTDREGKARVTFKAP